MENIIKRNFEYYRKNVLGYYYIFTTNKNESIVVKTAPENLAHLIGVKYATQNGLFRYSGTRFYDEMAKNGADNPPFKSIYDFISKQRDENSLLSQEELWCKGKNEVFIELFENLNKGNYNIKIYRNKRIGDFKANYLQIKVLNNQQNEYGYIGIYGNSSDNYFSFNSIIVDNGEKKDSGNYIEIKKFERISVKDFNETDFKFVLSPQNKKKTSPNTGKQKHPFILNKTIVNKINHKISPLSIQKGNLNKNNWALKKNKIVLIKELEKVKRWNSQNELIQFINDNFK